MATDSDRCVAAFPVGANPGAAVTPAGPLSGVLPFVLGSACLGTIGVFVHQAAVDPLTATWFRCAFGWLGLSAWIRLRGPWRMLRPDRADALRVLAASALMVLAWWLFFFAIARTSTGVAVVLFHLQPMWVLLLGRWWLREPVGRRRLVWVGIAMLGLMLATGVLEPILANQAPDHRPPGYLLGIAACLVGAACTAGVTLLAKDLRRMPSGGLAWWQCALGTLVLWVWPVQQGWPPWGAAWAWLAGLGWIHTAVAYTLLYAGMTRMTSGRIAVWQFAYPAVAILIDGLYFDQRLGLVQWVGMVLMVVAIVAAERRLGA